MKVAPCDPPCKPRSGKGAPHTPTMGWDHNGNELAAALPVRQMRTSSQSMIELFDCVKTI